MRPISGRIAQFFALARVETRLGFADAPAFARQAAVFVAWATTAIVMGSLLGFMAVILPPTPIFVIILLVAVVLLWVLPDLPLVSYILVRRMLIVALVVKLIVPDYYAIQILSIPWISARRLVLFPLIAVFAVALSTSLDARQWIVRLVSRNRLLVLCVFGFPVAALLSVLTSQVPTESLNAVVEIILEWYVPFAAFLYVMRKEEDVEVIIRILFWCALFVSIIGVLDFVFQRNLYLDLLPNSLVNSLMQYNPSFAAMVNEPQFRNGAYRADSVFDVSLNFAEFEAVIAALAAVFALHGRTTKDRVLGAVLVFVSFVGIFASGSRGGWVSVIVAFAALAALYSIRTYRIEPGSLKPGFIGLTAAVGFVVLWGLILSWGRMHNMVLGETYGDRDVQWTLGIPKILANPITGHGYALGGAIIGYGGPTRQSIDSFLLATLVETGILGTVCFFGGLLLSIWIALRRYLSDQSWQGALMGGLGFALLAYLTYRYVLAERANIYLMYLLLACVMVLNYSYLEGKAQEQSSRASPKKHPREL
jgi:hypothetical protein